MPDEAIMIDDNSLFVNFKTTCRNDRGELIGDFSIRGVWDRRVGSWLWKHELPAGTNPDGAFSAGFSRMLSKSDLSGTSFLPRTGHLVMIHLLRDSVRIDGVRGKNKKHVMHWTDPEMVIDVLPARTGEPVGRFPGDTYQIRSRWRVDRRSCGKDRFRSGACEITATLARFRAGIAWFSPSGKLLATWEKAKVTVWELEPKRERFQVTPASPMAFSPNERRVWRHAGVRLWSRMPRRVRTCSNSRGRLAGPRSPRMDRRSSRPISMGRRSGSPIGRRRVPVPSEDGSRETSRTG